LVAGKLHRDQFGLQKLLVAATTKGKLFALDSANGNVIWRTNLGLTSEQGPELQVKEMYNVRAVGEKGDAMLAVLATKTIGEVRPMRCLC
jgi:outer membrane protein assembly factor BamB